MLRYLCAATFTFSAFTTLDFYLRRGDSRPRIAGGEGPPLHDDLRPLLWTLTSLPRADAPGFAKAFGGPFASCLTCPAKSAPDPPWRGL